MVMISDLNFGNSLVVASGENVSFSLGPSLYGLYSKLGVVEDVVLEVVNPNYVCFETFIEHGSVAIKCDS